MDSTRELFCRIRMTHTSYDQAQCRWVAAMPRRSCHAEHGCDSILTNRMCPVCKFGNLLSRLHGCLTAYPCGCFSNWRCRLHPTTECRPCRMLCRWHGGMKRRSSGRQRSILNMGTKSGFPFFRWELLHCGESRAGLDVRKCVPHHVWLYTWLNTWLQASDHRRWGVRRRSRSHVGRF